MEGLTGHIMFNDDGKRYNYTLHVVQMTIDSTITKVRIIYLFIFLISILNNTLNYCFKIFSKKYYLLIFIISTINFA